ncbi:microfibrillar-associated protein 1-like [Paramacrobiotus metropolitanus]|uniref:microfibrillar-associated protein 1-like n=1 Tax=Paramacrobiotus metropolitanus TaxID=2943436 RepID=UPI002446177C|nr:microfibrillar-associated protein 1-like [Paramacrobiotus metropolitanus]
MSSSTFTAGAVPVRNEKGQVTMQKVKVTRYVSGKRPDYAPEYESSDEEDEFLVEGDAESRYSRVKPVVADAEYDEKDFRDPRLKRLQSRLAEASDEEPAKSGTDNLPSSSRRRIIAEPEIIAGADEGYSEQINLQRISLKAEQDSDEDEETIERRRALIRERAQQRMHAEEAAVKLEEEEVSDEESEYETTDSEDETSARLKPVFIRKHDRVTLKEREEEERVRIQQEREAERRADERKAESRRMVEAEVKREIQEQLQKKTSALDDGKFEIPVVIDNEDPEAEYEAWKVRELTRLKRDKDERDERQKVEEERERLNALTEEERNQRAKAERAVINKTDKGKMKFLQKYYHRGVFYLDKEDEVYKRDFTAPTLEDHHDKTVLPKVMQVKNFGRAGRTKYTHLVDQDTTRFDAAWTEHSNLNLKYFAGKAGGTKQVFDRPSAKRRKPNV